MEADRLLTPLYGLGVVGALLQVAGANWDVSSHILGIVDSFFTPSHLVLYLGILLVLIAGFLGVWFERRTGAKLRPFFTGFRVAFAGSLIQLVAGPLDLWWHSVYGFDPFLFTPTHSMLIVGLALGGVGMGVGTLRLLQRNSESTRFLKFLGALILGTLWLDVNFVVLWLVNAQGVAYTFGVCSPQVIAARSCAFVGAYERARGRGKRDGEPRLHSLHASLRRGSGFILLRRRHQDRRGRYSVNHPALPRTAHSGAAPRFACKAGGEKCSGRILGCGTTLSLHRWPFLTLLGAMVPRRHDSPVSPADDARRPRGERNQWKTGGSSPRRSGSCGSRRAPRASLTKARRRGSDNRFGSLQRGRYISHSLDSGWRIGQEPSSMNAW